jgi:hypothetical protein
VPITRGIMRNTWFPKKMAEYVTLSKLQELKRENSVPERDPAFGSKQERKAAVAAQRTGSTPAATQAEEESAGLVVLPVLSVRHWMSSRLGYSDITDIILQPQEAANVISKIIPLNINFYRTPIEAEQSKTDSLKMSPSIPATSAISAAAAEGQPKEVKEGSEAKTGIYGSVSTSDIAVNLQAVLAGTEGASVVLSSENISFVDQLEERNRVKHLGTFDIEIRLSSTVKGIRRTITVNAQE